MKTGQILGGKADRNGFFCVNDARTGKLVNAFPFVNKITWATGIDLKTGRPNFVDSNRPGDPAQGADPKQGKTVFVAPSFLGGKNQMPMAYSPDTKTGNIVWKFQTGSGVVAPPVTREDKGEQYVAVASGWGGAVPLWGGDVAKKVNYLEQGGSLWVFKLMK